MGDDFYKHSNISIKNIGAVFQYNLNIKKEPKKEEEPPLKKQRRILSYYDKVLTVFGEYHNMEMPCKDYSISLFEYITKTIQLNNNVKVFLEYDNIADIKSLISPINGIRSINIREIINGLSETDRKKYIYPVDCRNHFLGQHNHHELYYNSKLNTNIDFIKNKYIEPFFSIKIKEYTSISLDLKEVLEDYYNTLTRDFTWVKDNWDTIKNPADYKGEVEYRILYLRDNWARMVDYYILEEIFKDDGKDEYICILGDEHRKNLQKYLTHFFKKHIYHQENKDGNCISLTKMKFGSLPKSLLYSTFSS